MTFASDYWLNLMADAGSAFDVDVSLHTGAPGNDGTANEVPTSGGTGYARQTIPQAQLSDAAAGLVTNSRAVSYGNAGAAWGRVSHYAVWRGARLLFWKALAAPMQIGAGTPVSIDARQIEFDLNVAAA